MSTKEIQSKRSRLLDGLIVALFSGFSILAINIYITASSFRQSLEEQNRLNLNRTLNFLVIMKDELTGTKQNIENGSLDLVVTDTTITFPTAIWPMQMWVASRWNDDMLNIDSELLKLLAVIYNDIFQADNILDNIVDVTKISSANNTWLTAMTIGIAEEDPNAANAIRDAIKRVSPQIKAFAEEYKMAVQLVQKRVPVVLDGMEIKIVDLNRRLGR